MTYCYIIYSRKLDRFYVGITGDRLISRLAKHINSYYGKSSYTSKAQDWKLHYWIACKNRKQAVSIERHIKRMKSREYLLNLKRYPALTAKLLAKYS